MSLFSSESIMNGLWHFELEKARVENDLITSFKLIEQFEKRALEAI